MQHSTHALTDKVALVTGAAHRIGAAITRALHGAGMKVVLHYRSSQTTAQTLCDELNALRADSAFSVQADLHEHARLAPLVEQAAARWGRLDALINNASSFYPTAVGAITIEQWDDLVGSNLRAPLFLAQAAAPRLKKSSGCIVNIVDIHAERPLRGYPVYSIAKAGLVMLTRALACELGPEVRVNAVAPGAILWPEHDMDENTKARIIERTFLKRQGQPADIASAVLYLVRDAHYTSGHVMTVDGGRSLNS